MAAYDNLNAEQHGVEPASTSKGLRFPNLSRYGTEHPIDKALGYSDIAKELHQEAKGGAPSSEEVMAAAGSVISGGHQRGAMHMPSGGPSTVTMEQEEEE